MNRWRGRLDPEHAPGLRPTVATAVPALIAVPFTVLLVFVKTAFGPLTEIDRGAAWHLHACAIGNPGFARLMQVISDVFSPLTWRIAVGVAVAWLVWRGACHLALWAATTITAGGLLGLALKVVVARARPSLPDPVAVAPGAAFPSGHMVNATVGAGILLLLVLPLVRERGRVLAWTLAVLIPSVVGFSRIALGVHWVSDVVGGLLFGVAVVAATAAAFETWRRRDAGRRPARPLREGAGPEAKREIAPRRGRFVQ
ncbi:phosphatase PAP2 family protein [Microbispora hainanensis]|jgi:undecaprenyl-diphosphatase|uniref:Phosphatase PAP2 family protein n=1 Tax=Microbispora hainanensis TaxID=568844 RepID=A0ABZ1SY58_9ACTN|nr:MULTISPECIES: phosphatase PAP2 family protein [Microbispora]NJP28007.1 phosphatase PAP2 family protein [Microbispora sp. CL1-1]TQS10358.1 phosphatase PAP2 family protein [Microbispora sp. SCL1-1]